MKIKFLIMIFSAVLLTLTLRGIAGNPTSSDLNTRAWKEDGPFELSPERGKYSLMYSLLEDGSFQFSTSLANFTTPDLGYIDGKFVSLFPPGMSFVFIPFYLLGRYFGFAQLASSAGVALFALLNIWLIFEISRRLGASRSASGLASLVFLFATPSFPYAVSLYQHHLSVSLLLLSVFLTLFKKSWKSSAIVVLLAAFSVTVDYPNFFLMLPVLIVNVLSFANLKLDQSKLRINIHPGILLAGLAALLPLCFMLWFNYRSYGNPLQIGGSLISVDKLDLAGNPVFQIMDHQTSAIWVRNAGSFDTRRILAGLQILLFSTDRGVLVFTPVILFGVLGAYFFSHRSFAVLLLSVIAGNLLLYSMWGDPWGGWAFGSRYLIPAYSMLAIFLSLMLTRLNRKVLLLFIFWIVSLYSFSVNTLGALTSSANPPEKEIDYLQLQTGQEEKSTWVRNWDRINTDFSKSFVFNTYIQGQLTAVQYYWMLMFGLSFVSGLLVVGVIREKEVPESNV